MDTVSSTLTFRYDPVTNIYALAISFLAVVLPGCETALIPQSDCSENDAQAREPNRTIWVLYAEGYDSNSEFPSGRVNKRDVSRLEKSVENKLVPDYMRHYGAHLQSNRCLSGSLDLYLTVAENGAVVKVLVKNDTFYNRELVSGLMNAALRWKFDAVPESGYAVAQARILFLRWDQVLKRQDVKSAAGKKIQ